MKACYEGSTDRGQALLAHTSPPALKRRAYGISMSNKTPEHRKIINLNEIRAHKKPGVIQLLKDSRKTAQAIAAHTCLICNSKKMCVNKTGVCASCYDTALTHEEKKVAQEEARHKQIKITVTDDRWEK